MKKQNKKKKSVLVNSDATANMFCRPNPLLFTLSNPTNVIFFKKIKNKKLEAINVLFKWNAKKV